MVIEKRKDGACDSDKKKSDIDGITESIDKMVISDDKLFADPPPKEDCPICMLPMPYAGGICGVRTAYQPCCGKIICTGCMHAVDGEIKKGSIKRSCSMCRVPIPSSKKELLNRFKRRLKMNDAAAIHTFSNVNLRRTLGLSQDSKEIFDMNLKAAELGSIRAHDSVAKSYLGGVGVEQDIGKAKYHLRMSAMGGCETARYCLGVYDEFDGKMDLAMKHYMIAAKSGEDDALKKVGEGYKAGHVTKDEYASTLRAHKVTHDEMKSKQRTDAPKSSTL